MPEIWDGGAPRPTDPLLTSGGKSEVSAIVIGAYWFPTTDSRDDVGFLGSLPLSPPTKSKPVTPWYVQPHKSNARCTCRPPWSTPTAGRRPRRSCRPGSRSRRSRQAPGAPYPSGHALGAAAQRAVDLLLRVPAGQVLSLVVALLALGETELDLRVSVVEVDRQRHQGDAVVPQLADQLGD